MKRIFLLSIISLFLYSCVGDIPTDLNKGGDKTEYANLIIANTDYYNSTLRLLCGDMVLPEVSFRSKVKVPYPILPDNTYKVGYKDVLGENHVLSLGNLEANKTYILAVNPSAKRAEIAEYIGDFSMQITNKTSYPYTCLDIYNNKSYTIQPSKTALVKNLPCYITNTFFFQTNYPNDDIKYSQYFEDFKKIAVNKVFDYSITDTPRCDEYNLCVLQLINNSEDNFCLLDKNKKEILVVAPGNIGEVVSTAGSSTIYIRQKDGYIFYPDEYTFNEVIPKCGSVDFSVFDDDCTWKIYN